MRSRRTSRSSRLPAWINNLLRAQGDGDRPPPSSGLGTSCMIVVSSLNDCAIMAAQHRPSHVLTLLSPDHAEQTLPLCAPAPAYLKLHFHDITEKRAGLIEPNIELITAILQFGRSWSSDHPMLIHCWAGISRSSAAAFLIACDRNDQCEDRIARELRQRAPFATPNRLMVALADDLLGRAGRMLDAVDRIGRGVDAFEGTPY
jgi:predicted protein tyrosine phosphatase